MNNNNNIFHELVSNILDKGKEASLSPDRIRANSTNKADKILEKKAKTGTNEWMLDL